MSTEAELRAFVTKVANLDGRTEVRMIDLLLLVREAKALVETAPAATPAETPKEDTPHDS